MASVKVKRSKSKESEAAHLLRFALGEERVELNKLRPSELEGILAEWFDEIDFRRLHGFKELREELSQRGDGIFSLTLTTSSDAELKAEGFSEKLPLTFKSHVFTIWQGVIDGKRIYRHYESGEETSDIHMGFDWEHKKRGFLHRGSTKWLMIRRLPESYPECDETCLVEVEYEFSKVPDKKEFLITAVSARPVPISGFCKRFGEKAGHYARLLILEVKRVYAKTADDLRSESEMMKRDTDKWEKRAESTR